MKAAGLDPDIPPPLFARLAMIESLWGFDDAEAAECARALAADDTKALKRLRRRNRRFVAAVRARLESVSRALMRPVWAPALRPPRVPVLPRSAGRRARRKVVPWFDVMGIGRRGAPSE